MEDCAFCAIWEDPANAVTTVWARTESLMVLSPIGPKNPGHLLFIPKRHVEFAHEDPMMTGWLFEEAASWLRRVPTQQGNLVINSGRAAGQSVPHLHVHLIPRGKGDKIAEGWPWS